MALVSDAPVGFTSQEINTWQKRLRDADLAFARLHNEVNIHSNVKLICRPMISDTNAEGRLYPLIWLNLNGAGG
jgi:hypothetical protein